MRKIRFLIVSLAMYLTLISGISAQTTEFSYQGFVTDNNAAANGNYDLEFRLFTVETGGTVVGTQIRLNVPVTNGIFSVALDFGSFPNSDRYLEIGVKPAGGGSFTYLAPRSKVLSTPYATNAINAQSALSADNAANATNATNATTAQNALQLGGISPDGFIRNSVSQQAASNFNISGAGTVGGLFTGNTISATTQYNFANTGRIMAKFGVNNLYVGTLAGNANGGIQNTMLGDGAGRDNTGNENVLVGFVAGQNSTTGSNNSFFGSKVGLANTFGGSNAFFGAFAGDTNTTGSNNTIIGTLADVGSNNLTNAIAIGHRAFVESGNSLVLGSVNGKNGAIADTKVGIGTTTPNTPLDIESEIVGNPSLRITNYGNQVAITGRSSGGTRSAPTSPLNGDRLLTIQADGYESAAGSFSTGAKIEFTATSEWIAGRRDTAINFYTDFFPPFESPRMTITEQGDVGIGNTSPDQKLDVNGNVRIGVTTGVSDVSKTATALLLPESAHPISDSRRISHRLTKF